MLHYYRFIHIFDSALLLIPLKIDQTVDESMKGPLFGTAFKNIKIGWNRIYQDKALLRIIFAKSSWNIGGAGLQVFS